MGDTDSRDELRDDDGNFLGYAQRDCGEHRTVGPHRAWCYDCTEWCYPGRDEGECAGCARPDLTTRLVAAEARATAAEERIEAVRAIALQWSEQPTDYDEDTEQQIDDGCAVLAALGPSTAPRHRWDHAALDELVRRRNAFTGSWGEVISDMKAETTEAGGEQ